MSADRSPSNRIAKLPPKFIQPAVALFLFAATAGFILWQNAHVAVLWDLSFLLDSAYRFSLGQIPYRDLPFSHAPLTFLFQAAIIRLFGRVYWHTIAYAAVAGGLGTLLVWRLLCWLLRLLGSSALWLTTLLAAPLIVLGIYSVYPHPIYDSDATLAVLVALCLLQRALRADDQEKPPAAIYWSALAGIGCAVPMFFKVNVGLPFLGSVLVVSAFTAGAKSMRGERITRELYVIGSALVALLAGLAALHQWAGLGNYLHWTVQFAAQRRLPALNALLGTYHQTSLLWTLPCSAAAVWLLGHRATAALTWRRALAIVLLSAPFLCTVIEFLGDSDADDRADQLLALWPHLLLVALAVAIYDLRLRPALRTLVSWVLLATIHGTFVSQQLWGSTYAIWPLLVLLIAFLIARVPGIAVPLSIIASASLLVCGALYATSHERLDYVHLEGSPTHSVLPSLLGMTTPGPWIPGFEELVHFTEAEIPPMDGVLLVPGEDPFFFATGRTPTFPVLLFDPATFPYTPQQAVTTARASGIRWLILKRDLQLTQPPYDQLPAITAALQQDFAPYQRLALYDVYRRR